MKKRVLLILVLIIVILFIVFSDRDLDVKEYLISKGCEIGEVISAEEYTYYEGNKGNFKLKVYESDNTDVLQRLYYDYEMEARQIFDDYQKAHPDKLGDAVFTNYDENPEVYNPSKANFVATRVKNSKITIGLYFYRNIKDDVLITAYFDVMQDYDKKAVDAIRDKLLKD